MTLRSYEVVNENWVLHEENIAGTLHRRNNYSFADEISLLYFSHAEYNFLSQLLTDGNFFQVLTRDDVLS